MGGNIVRGGASVLAMGGLIGLLAVGSQVIRHHNPPPVAVVITPSPMIIGTCTGPADHQTCSVGGGDVSLGDAPPTAIGPVCNSTDPSVCNPPCDPIQWPGRCIDPNGGIAAVTPPTGSVPPSAGSVAPGGTIEAGATSFLAGSGPGARLGIMVVVLSGGQYVSGAVVSGSCAGNNFTGTTADRSAWSPTKDPSIPSGPSAFYWVVLTGNFQGIQVCHGTATFGGMAASF